MGLERLTAIVIMVCWLNWVGAQSVTDSTRLHNWSLITGAIDLLRPEDYKPLKAVRANAKKGRLVRRYNRWLSNGKITAVQYDALVSELLQVKLERMSRMIEQVYGRRYESEA